jgi:hypothetical protein
MDSETPGTPQGLPGLQAAGLEQDSKGKGFSNRVKGESL